MNYLSFDVGIKNLAFCELTPQKKIKQWGIINMNSDPTCNMCLKKPCDKQASSSLTIDGEVKYYCSTHIKHKSLDKKGKKRKLNTNRDILELSKVCVGKLKELDLSNIKYVLIENQPALKNPVMKSVQMIIYTFFVMAGVMEEKSSIENIHMVNARNKLKVYKGEPIKTPYSDDKKNKYRNNKYLSVKYTALMIHEEEDSFQKLYEGSKKKDDLADAYLQGIYWIEK
jgi:hypothetical protein